MPVGQLTTNCYLLHDDKSRDAIVIDPGDDPDFIIQKISDLDLDPKLIIATHAHFDHILAVREIKIAFKIPFAMHELDIDLLKWMRRSTKYFAGFDPGPPPTPDKFLVSNEIIKIGDSSLKIIHTPGHTPGGIALYSKRDEFLIAGDNIFAGGSVGRTDFPYCSKTDLQKSIKKLIALPSETIVYSGHGEETTIGEFKKAWDLRET